MQEDALHMQRGGDQRAAGGGDRRAAVATACGNGERREGAGDARQGEGGGEEKKGVVTRRVCVGVDAVLKGRGPTARC